MIGATWKRFAGFVAIGGLGFAIEATIITAATSTTIGLSAAVARFFSFPCAVTVTWWLNRHFNFRTSHDALSEAGRYIATQGVGALANLVLFTVCVSFFPLFAQWPILALGVGACAGLAVNFLLSQVFVFKEKSNLHGD